MAGIFGYRPEDHPVTWLARIVKFPVAISRIVRSNHLSPDSSRNAFMYAANGRAVFAAGRVETDARSSALALAVTSRPNEQRSEVLGTARRYFRSRPVCRRADALQRLDRRVAEVCDLASVSSGSI